MFIYGSTLVKVFGLGWYLWEEDQLPAGGGQGSAGFTLVLTLEILRALCVSDIIKYLKLSAGLTLAVFYLSRLNDYCRAYGRFK
jgi:hypothetical protein